MSRILYVFLSAFILNACSQGDQQVAGQVDAAATQESGVILANMDDSVAPGEDFTAYVNGTWMKNTEIPADKSSYGVGYMVHEKSQEDVKAIIEESASGDFANGSNEQKVGDLFQSFMDTDKRNELGVKPLADELSHIDGLGNHSDLAAYFARARKLGYATPFGLFVYPDLKDPTQYGLYIPQAGLGLPDREYYFNEDEKSVEIREKYVAHIEKMFDLAGVGNGDQAAETVMALETRIAAEHMLKEDTRDIVKLYNPYEIADLEELMPDFDWQAYLDAMDAPKLDRLIIMMVDYTKAMNEIIATTDMQTWQTYLQWSLINATASRVTEELDQQNFEFYEKTMRGTQEQLPMWRRGVTAVNGDLGEVVGKVYVKRHFPPEAKERMLVLVGNLIKAYAASIEELDWMSEETKVEALDKLSKFTPKIGYPDIWKAYADLEIDALDYFGNRERSRLVEYQRDIEKIGGPIQKHEWGMTPQTVNAYYSPALNEIVFPAAILQPPFFDLSVDNAVNYGAIGAVIGHEIGHGFDDSGSAFDGDGVLRNWWTDADKAEFEKRTAALIAQYDEFKVFDDLNVNGTFTLGENIGDLGGLSIALKAYKMTLDGETPEVIDGFTGVQRVFIGYAQAWLRKDREERLRQQVGTDPHSPARFRVNGVVRNVPEFYEAFDVQESDALYLAPEERVKIW